MRLAINKANISQVEELPEFVDELLRVGSELLLSVPLALLVLEPFSPRFDKVLIVATIVLNVLLVEEKDVGGDFVEELAIVGDNEDGGLPGLEVILQPNDSF